MKAPLLAQLLVGWLLLGGPLQLLAAPEAGACPLLDWSAAAGSMVRASGVACHLIGVASPAAAGSAVRSPLDAPALRPARCTWGQ